MWNIIIGSKHILSNMLTLFYSINVKNSSIYSQNRHMLCYLNGKSCEYTTCSMGWHYNASGMIPSMKYQLFPTQVSIDVNSDCCQHGRVFTLWMNLFRVSVCPSAAMQDQESDKLLYWEGKKCSYVTISQWTNVYQRSKH